MSDPRFPTTAPYVAGNQQIANAQPDPPFPGRLSHYEITPVQQPIPTILPHGYSTMPIPWQSAGQTAPQSPANAHTVMTVQSTYYLQQEIQTVVIENQPVQPSYPPPPTGRSPELPFAPQTHPAPEYDENTATGAAIGPAINPIPHAPSQAGIDQQGSEPVTAASSQPGLNPYAREFHPAPSGPTTDLPPDGPTCPPINRSDINEAETTAGPAWAAGVEGLPDMDIALLLLPSDSKADPAVDSDMSYLYCKKQKRPAPPPKKITKPLLFIHRNQNMFWDNNLNNHNERMKLMASLTKDIDKDKLTEGIPPSSPLLCPGQFFGRSSKLWITSAENFIFLSLLPYLPHTCQTTITFSAAFLPGYRIPFSTCFFKLTDKLVEQHRKKYRDEELPSYDMAVQFSLIGILFHVMHDSLEKKTKKLAELAIEYEPDCELTRDLVIHSKYISHMVLTALLMFESDQGLCSNNDEHIKYILSIFMQHIVLIDDIKNKNKEAQQAYLELIRALLCLMNHDLAKKYLLPEIMDATSPASEAKKNDKSTRARLTRKLEQKNKKSSDSDNNNDVSTQKSKTSEMALLVTLINSALCSCSNVRGLESYYFSIMHTICDSPVFSQKYLSDLPEPVYSLIEHLKNFIHWMDENLKTIHFFDRSHYENQAIINEIDKWIPKLAQVTAALLGRSKDSKNTISDLKWLRLRVKNTDQQSQGTMGSQLKSLATGLNELAQTKVTQKLSEDRLSRKFDQEINNWAKKMDKRSAPNKKNKAAKSNKKTYRSPGNVNQPDNATTLKSADSPQPERQDPAPGATDFTKAITSLCGTLHGSESFEKLHEITEEQLAPALIHPAHKVYCFLEIGLCLFDKNRRLIISTARSMEKSHALHHKLTTVIPPESGDITQKKDAIKFLKQHFSNDELSLKNIALLASNTELEVVKQAKERLRNLLLFINLSIQYGNNLLEKMKQEDYVLQGELNTTELISHLEACQDLIVPLDDYNKNLHRTLVTYELNPLKLKLFKKLRLYGSGSFKSNTSRYTCEPATGLNKEDLMAPLQQMKQNQEQYESYNQGLDSNEKINTEALLHDFTQLHNSLKVFLDSNGHPEKH